MFTIRNFEARTLSWWYDQRDSIDFKPSYQRKGRLWSIKDKSYLIDSILNGFDMPKLYIADFTFFSSQLNENRKPYAVVDGKQRFEAMFDFFSGKLTLDKEFVLLDEPKLKLGLLSYKDLKAKHPKIASKFENFNLSVISIITDSESMINEMFIRLNTSKPLTGAELRNAMTGEVPKLTRSLSDHHFFKDKIRFNIQRGQDLNVATKLLLTEFRGKFVDTQKTHLDKLVDDVIAAEAGGLDNAFKKVKLILGYMDSAFIPKDPLLSSSGLMVVYYWLFRTYGGANKQIIRNFLVDFDRNRKENKRTQKDKDFTDFDLLTRSINNQANLQGCYNILVKKWEEWINTNKKAE
jgi:hypothetical protein